MYTYGLCGVARALREWPLIVPQLWFFFYFVFRRHSDFFFCAVVRFVRCFLLGVFFFFFLFIHGNERMDFILWLNFVSKIDDSSAIFFSASSSSLFSLSLSRHYLVAAVVVFFYCIKFLYTHIVRHIHITTSACRPAKARAREIEREKERVSKGEWTRRNKNESQLYTLITLSIPSQIT